MSASRLASVGIASTELDCARRALVNDDVAAAVTILDQILRRTPDDGEALALGGYILQLRGQAIDALRFYDRALVLRPDPLVWFNRGVLLLGAKAPEAALESFSVACALAPDLASYHCNRGAALFELGRLEEAVEAYRKALARDPRLAEAELNLGNALMRLGSYRAAREAYLRALALRPAYAAAHCGHGIVAKELGAFDEARIAFDRALALAPESAEALSNRGCLDLLLGDFASGWEGYEHRWENGDRPVPISDVRFDLSRPETVVGRKILIVNDHGLGDTIQFFRYVLLLARAGAEVSFAAPRKLRRLLGSAGVPLHWRDEQDVDGVFDAVLAISSLPRAFQTRIDTIPAPTPYLFAEPDLIARWRARLEASGSGFRIGLCWRGNLDVRVDPRRSIPPDCLRPLAEMSGVKLVSLQKGGEAPPWLAHRFVDLAGVDAGPDAFVDTAALMASLDLVVTCDTSIAHLAGALGRPVWVALRHVSEWRWMNQRADSPWYSTMRLFRCAPGDDWTTLIAGMAMDVKKIQPVDNC